MILGLRFVTELQQSHFDINNIRKSSCYWHCAGFLHLTGQITDRHGWPEAHGDDGKETAGRKKTEEKSSRGGRTALIVYRYPATSSARCSLQCVTSYQWEVKITFLCFHKCQLSRNKHIYRCLSEPLSLLMWRSCLQKHIWWLKLHQICFFAFGVLVIWHHPGCYNHFNKWQEDIWH